MLSHPSTLYLHHLLAGYDQTDPLHRLPSGSEERTLVQNTGAAGMTIGTEMISAAGADPQSLISPGTRATLQLALTVTGLYAAVEMMTGLLLMLAMVTGRGQERLTEPHMGTGLESEAQIGMHTLTGSMTGLTMMTDGEARSGVADLVAHPGVALPQLTGMAL